MAGSGLLILAGGLSILTGAWPKIGAGLISMFLLGVSPQSASGTVALERDVPRASHASGTNLVLTSMITVMH